MTLAYETKQTHLIMESVGILRLTLVKVRTSGKFHGASPLPWERLGKGESSVGATLQRSPWDARKLAGSWGTSFLSLLPLPYPASFMPLLLRTAPQ